MESSKINLDIIITTYNRQEKIKELVRFIQRFKRFFDLLIVVDSSEVVSKKLYDDENVVYLRSSYKNQPYQRYLGFIYSKSKWLLYLDDDMELLHNTFDKIAQLIHVHNDKGLIGLGFRNRHQETFVAKMPKSILGRFNNLGFTRMVR